MAGQEKLFSEQNRAPLNREGWFTLSNVVSKKPLSKGLEMPTTTQTDMKEGIFGRIVGAAAGAVVTPVGGAAVDVKVQLEKIVGRNNLMSIAWLNEGLRLSRAIGRVVTPDGLGTGFMISPDLMLTNNHVLDSSKTAEKSYIEFNFQSNWSGKSEPTQRFPIDVSIFKTNPTLDYTIVRVHNAPGSPEQFGFVDIGQSAMPREDDRLSIIQHPAGRQKEISLTDNLVTGIFGNVVQYTTDTENGSSGSPVFNAGWRLVALHHAGGSLPGPNGQTVFGNEGILITKIINDARTVLGLDNELLTLVTGEIMSKLVEVGLKAKSPLDFQVAAVSMNRKYPNFRSALVRASISDGSNEIEPFTAAAIGVGVGAMIRYVGKKMELSSIPGSSADELVRPSTQLMDFVAQLTGDAGINSTKVFVETTNYVKQNPSTVANADKFAKAMSISEIVGVDDAIAVAFLVGVATGSLAMDGKSLFK